MVHGIEKKTFPKETFYNFQTVQIMDRKTLQRNKILAFIAYNGFKFDFYVIKSELISYGLAITNWIFFDS